MDGRHNPIGTVTSCGAALEFNVFTLHPLLPLAWDNSWFCRFHRLIVRTLKQMKYIMIETAITLYM
jgi:hypothetical protein